MPHLILDLFEGVAFLLKYYEILPYMIDKVTMYSGTLHTYGPLKQIYLAY